MTKSEKKMCMKGYDSFTNPSSFVVTQQNKAVHHAAVWPAVYNSV